MITSLRNVVGDYCGKEEASDLAAMKIKNLFVASTE
jgi:hypothetical protein